MHVYHEWPEGKQEPILYDNCPECDKRASEPWALDGSNFKEAWQLMVNVEHPSTAGEGRIGYLTWNEKRLGRELYKIAVLMERHMGIDPWRWPPEIRSMELKRLHELLGPDDAIASRKAES